MSSGNQERLDELENESGDDFQIREAFLNLLEGLNVPENISRIVIDFGLDEVATESFSRICSEDEVRVCEWRNGTRVCSCKKKS